MTLQTHPGEQVGEDEGTPEFSASLNVHATKREMFARPEPTSIQLKEASKNGTNNMGKKQITRNC